MLNFLEPFVGYANGASHSMQNLSSAAWAIFTPSSELVSFRGICIGRSTNNIAEYSALIELLSNAISLGIHRIIIRLDSTCCTIAYWCLYYLKPSNSLDVP